MIIKLLIVIFSGMLLAKNSLCENYPKDNNDRTGQAIAKSFDVLQIEQLKARGYETSNGSYVYDGGVGQALSSQLYCLINRDHFPVRPVVIEKCVVVIETAVGRDSDGGHPILHHEDAILIDLKGNHLFDSADTNCVSSIYPNLSVFAVGQWELSTPPLVGGYAQSIKLAWVIDPVIKKFKEIPVNSVKCEINEDRD